ncbi:MAG: DUF4158 domain-containing protein [Chryseobacterium sp.]
MPRKQVLTDNEKSELFSLPELEDEFIRCYSLSERDISIIQNNCRKNANKLGFAVLLSYMQNPGTIIRLYFQMYDKILTNKKEQ